MVEQLLESAELLAKSERESAWREMAKQIAHEIKNPLTPMKLGIQHLQRTWKNGEKEDEEQIDRIVKIIIEQIDNLSSIATEFSNFAQMPIANNTKINVVDVLNDSVKLFEDENYNIQLFLNGNDQVFVYADKEQLNRVFINLIKNSIQAIPENTTPKIEIGLDVKKDKVIMQFKDNGKGIPPEVRDKLFQPNFTTKSSGMGMGLAIVQNVVRNAGGKVYYDTEMNRGSSFYVQLPLIKDGTIE
jgi:nitrogen fixation/metabolism regulation signal transduction histidine kinase